MEPRALPADVVQFFSLVLFQLISVVAYFVVFAAIRRPLAAVVASAKPDGPVANAPGIFSWAYRLAQVRGGCALAAPSQA